MRFCSPHRICYFLMLGLCFLCAKRTCAQKRAAYILDTAPAPESEENYRISFSTSVKAVTVSFLLRGPHAINLRAEYFRSASAPKAFEIAHLYTADWKFRSVPVTVSYTYALPSPSSRIFPVAGFGLSAHVYKQTEKVEHSTGMPYNFVLQSSIESLTETILPHFANKYGLNVGAEVSLGLIMNVSKNIFVMSQGRYRYIACSGHHYGYNYSSLRVLDFSVDIGFQF